MLFRSLRLHHREMQGYSKKTQGLWLPNLPYKTWIWEHNAFLAASFPRSQFFIFSIWFWFIDRQVRSAASPNQYFLLFNLDEKKKTSDHIASYVLDHFILSCCKKKKSQGINFRNWRRIFYYFTLLTPQRLHRIIFSSKNKYNKAIMWNCVQ